MSNEMTVGCIRTTVTPPLASGIYGALLEKAERDNAELADRLSGLELSTTQKLAQIEQERDKARDTVLRLRKQRAIARNFGDQMERERDEARALLERKWDKEDPPLVRMMSERDEAREESLEQARLLGKGGEREARLITERDHYKRALEEIATTIQEYKDSIVQEPAEDFIWAIKAWADKKLKEI